MCTHTHRHTNAHTHRLSLLHKHTFLIRLFFSPTHSLWHVRKRKRFELTTHCASSTRSVSINVFALKSVLLQRQFTQTMRNPFWEHHQKLLLILSVFKAFHASTLASLGNFIQSVIKPQRSRPFYDELSSLSPFHIFPLPTTTIAKQLNPSARLFRNQKT